MKTEKIAAALRCSSQVPGPQLDCRNCSYHVKETVDGVDYAGCDCDRITVDAADRLEELVDRCARYAEEIAVLRERGKRAVEDASPYAVGTERQDVGGGALDVPGGKSMQRVTKRCNGIVAYVGASNTYETGQIPAEVDTQGVRELLCSLAAYEDTRLTAEEVAALQKEWSDLCTVIGECGGLDRIKELAKADKDGRIAILPCEPGGVMLDMSDLERPEMMERLHFAVAYVRCGIVFHQPYKIFLENVTAGHIRPVSGLAEKMLGEEDWP